MKGAKVYNLDIHEPHEAIPGVTYVHCNVADWSQLQSAFKVTGTPHIAIANAGVDEDGSYVNDLYDEHGSLLEPSYAVIDVNLRGTLNFMKIALCLMKKSKIEGSIVITSSATAYLPEQTLPVYSATKAAVSSHAME